MLTRYAMAFGALAVVLTLAWLFIDDRRVTFTSGLSFILWGFLALEGGDLEVMQNGSNEAAALPDEARLILALFAMLSLLAFVLYRVGAYPPASEQPADEEVPDAKNWTKKYGGD